MVLNERVLRVVVTLADELHFGRTAEVLHVSQPSLSGTVKDLERYLGVQLFTRTSRNVELTRAGRVFADEARRLISEGERITASVRNCAPDNPRPFRAGYSSTIHLPWLCGLMAYAKSHGFSNDNVRFISDNEAGCLERLLKGDLDGVFLTGRLASAGIASMPLRHISLQAVVPRTHALAGTSQLALAQLKEYPLVWLERASNRILFGDFEAACSDHFYRPEMVQEVKTFYECAEFAAHGLGITFVPSFLRSQFKGRPVIFRKLAGDPLRMEQFLYYRPENECALGDRFMGVVRCYLLATNRPVFTGSMQPEV